LTIFVVDDLPTSRRFYQVIFEALDIPIEGSADDHFGLMSFSFRLLQARRRRVN
jgi:hypothetical protein